MEPELIGGQLISRVPGRVDGRVSRAAITDVAEDDKVAIFYRSRKRFHYVPRAAVFEAGGQELHQWLVAG